MRLDACREYVSRCVGRCVICQHWHDVVVRPRGLWSIIVFCYLYHPDRGNGSGRMELNPPPA